MTEAVSDMILLERCRAGERSAFGALVERHQRAVCAMTYALTGDVALSEDLAQDTFLAAWRDLGRLEDASRFRAWVCRIARNLGLNARRNRGRRKEVDASEAELSQREDLDALIDQKDATLLVRAALDRLPDKSREVLVLYYREGRSAAEVAKALDISVAAVQQRLSRGRKRLEQRVELIVGRALERERPRRGFAAAVVAALPSARAADAAPSTPATASHTTLGVAAAAVVIAGGALLLWRGAEAPSPTPEARPEPPGVSTPAAAAAAPDADELRRKREVARAEAPPPKPPRPFRLTKVTDDDYAMNLEGGASRAVSVPRPPGEPAPPIPPVVRTVRGVVLDGEGAPVTGAVVIGDDRISYRKRGIRGSAGDTTDADGRFTLNVRTELPFMIIAAHRKGFSEFVAVPEGKDGAKVSLQLGAPGYAEGQVRRGGVGIEQQMNMYRLVNKRVAVYVAFDTDDAGTYRSPPLPPGEYRINAQGPGYEPLHGDPVVVARGRDVSRDLEASSGGKLEMFVELGEATEPFLVANLLTGSHVIEDEAALERVRRLPGMTMRHMVLQFDARTDPIVFEDVAVGEYTACARIQGRPGRSAVWMRCATGALTEEGGYDSITLPPLQAMTTEAAP
ncbi:MAG: sigma-70 family RNA polymerase sigma factor [Myxococcota bacterium]